MISGRMMAIINYLNDKSISSIKEISADLSIDSRKIRYDIDNINDLLKTYNKNQIVKKSKGVLEIPEDFDISSFYGDKEYIFSQRERVEILELTALFKIEDFNLEKFTKKFNVSRSTIKNDLSILEEEFEQSKIEIKYDKGFILIGDKQDLLQKRVNVLKRYTYIIEKDKSELSYFEGYILEIIEGFFLGRSVSDINTWTNDLLMQIGWVLNDGSYYWYLSNILVFCWYIINEQKHPFEEEKVIRHLFDDKVIERLQQIIKCKLNSNQIDILMNFALFTSKYSSLNYEMDLITTEKSVNQLLIRMSKKLNIDFRKDMILYKGLLNHIAPLLERLNHKIQIYDNLNEVIPEKYKYISDCIRESLKDIPILNEITNKNEIDLLTIHFLGSIQRSDEKKYKRILLVCGLGYGMIAMIKDKLINSYQVNVVKSIPYYKLGEFKDWDKIDLVVSTSKIYKKIPKPIVEINPFLKDEDYINLQNAGLYRKNTLTNYFSINRRLDFLDKETKKRVMDVIKDELGYNDVRMQTRELRLGDLIGVDIVKIIDKPINWKEAVIESTKLLSDCGFVGEDYADNIIDIQEKVGFYSVKDDEFALLHGNNNSVVNMSSMGVLVSKYPIEFGDKKTNIVFILASKDKKEQIPAIINLTKITYEEDFIKELKQVEEPEDIIDVINRYEDSVLKDN